MSVPKKFKGPVTGRVYDLEHGEVIDPAAEGIGCAGAGGAIPEWSLTVRKSTAEYSSDFGRRWKPSCAVLSRTPKISLNESR